LTEDERERVMDTMLGVQKVLTELYTGETPEMMLNAETEPQSQVATEQTAACASTDAPVAPISPSPDQTPAP